MSSTLHPVLAIRDVLPHQILAVPRVHIKLELEGADLNFPRRSVQTTRTGARKAVNQFLFALVDLLNSDGRQRHVTLSATPTLTGPVLGNDRYISWPLVKLHPRIEFELKQGFEPTAVQAFQDKILDLRTQHAVEDLGYTPLTDFRRIQSLIQRPSAPRNRMHGFAHKYYGDAAAALDFCDFWIHAIDRDTSVMIIMANGLFDVAEKQQDLADAVEPPEFLRRVIRLTAADEGYELAQQRLEAMLDFLSQRVAQEGSERGLTGL